MHGIKIYYTPSTIDKVDTVNKDNSINDKSINDKLDSILNIIKSVKGLDKDNELQILYKTVKSEIYSNYDLPPIHVMYDTIGIDNVIGLYVRENLNSKILVHTNLKDNYELKRNTIAHELIHYYLDYNNIVDDHEAPFIAEMKRINKLGYNVTL